MLPNVPSTGIRIIADLRYYPPSSRQFDEPLCRADVYLPAEESFLILVWFHGGGLVEGDKSDPHIRAMAIRVAEAGIGVVMANYRLSPAAEFPVYVEDAAAAVKWALEQAPKFGADARSLFIGGDSAGAYLAALLALDGRFLRAAEVPENQVAGVIPVSGQMMTHFTVKRERGSWNEVSIIADEAAPIFHIRREAPPFLLIVADDDLPGRVEENRFFAAALGRLAGNPAVDLVMVANRDHGSVCARLFEEDDTAGAAIAEFLAKHRKNTR